VATHDSPTARALRIAADDEQRVLSELSRGQRMAGLSDESIGRAARISRWTVGRILSGRQKASLSELAVIGAAVGRDVRMQAYVAGDPLRDAGQQRLLERFRARLHPDLLVRTEVPLPIAGDQRAWDLVVQGHGWTRPVELETVLDDLQALERRLRLKMRDAAVENLVLVVSDTKRNRLVLAGTPAAFPGFSRDSRPALRALGTAQDPGASSLLVL
jgi:hypothetical protein